MTFAWVTWFMTFIVVVLIWCCLGVMLRCFSLMARGGNVMDRLMTVLELAMSFGFMVCLFEMLKGVVV